MNAVHLMLLLGAVGQVQVRADQVTDQSTNQDAAERLEFMKASAQAVRITLDPDHDGPTLSLRPDPVFRSSNAMGRSNGGLFLWTADGRPEAIVEMVYFEKQNRWMNNFQSALESETRRPTERKDDLVAGGRRSGTESRPVTPTDPQIRSRVGCCR